jgi:hypothetical protein
MNHIEARIVVESALELQFPDLVPVRSVCQALQGVCWLETQYGQGWKGQGAGSNNWGAVQGGRPPCNLVTGFQYTDTHPNPDGTSTPYSICFKRYGSPVLGCADVARIMYGTPAKQKAALERAIAGDLYGVSAAMRAQGFYEGFGRTQAERIANHHKALLRAVTRIAQAIGEPMPSGSEPPPPTLRLGSHGEAVRDWQRALNAWREDDADLATDGAFGRITEARTKMFQAAMGLHADGVVGPLSWGAVS